MLVLVLILHQLDPIEQDSMKIEEIDGSIISAEELKLKKAIEIYFVASRLNYFNIKSCIRREDNFEIIIIDIEVSRPQRIKIDIDFIEPIAIIVSTNNVRIPEVLALRKDFPKDLIHTNIRDKPYPVSLCIYEEDSYELALKWTAYSFLEDVRDWFSLSATNNLHSLDQPLEPFLSGAVGEIILPNDYFTEKFVKNFLYVHKLKDSNTYIGSFERINDKSEFYLGVFISLKFQIHGKINYAPQNLFQLNQLLSKDSINIIPELLNDIKNLYEVLNINKELRCCKTFLIFRVPILRQEGNEPERHDLYVFKVDKTIFEIGELLDIWEIKSDINDNIAPIICSKPNFDNLTHIPIEMLNYHIKLSPQYASLYNGINHSTHLITLIGTGALGSQVFSNLARMGFGNWLLIDNDKLYPHNIARHSLYLNFIGCNKALASSYLANNQILDNVPFSKAFQKSVYDLSEEEIEEVGQSELIIDISTSISVSRYLALDLKTNTKRVSAFLNPSGTSLIILTEDTERKYRLDLLEMQYYRHLVYENCLEGHLNLEEGKIRYARGCRDITNKINQENVSIFSAICSNRIRQIVKINKPILSIWNIDNVSLEIKLHDFTPSNWEIFEISGWHIYVDTWFLEKILNHRKSRIPKETGGIIIGAYDHSRKIVYIVDSILSPTDSKEYPTAYIRGIENVQFELDSIMRKTNNALNYLGEWHSHPDNYSLSFSSDDAILFNWLCKNMDSQGLPAIMIIAGNGNVKLFVN